MSARRTDFPAKLLDAAVPTRTVVWSALELIECAICEQKIQWGDLFTKALAPGYGRRHVPHCRNCRPFNVLYAEMTWAAPGAAAE